MFRELRTGEEKGHRPIRTIQGVHEHPGRVTASFGENLFIQVRMQSFYQIVAYPRSLSEMTRFPEKTFELQQSRLVGF